jgi:methylenetetrahydrofolate reductase (NADPH)
MSIIEIFKRKRFVVTYELTPPKGVNFADALEVAQDMSQFVDAINVTDGQGAVMRMGSLPLCHLLLDKGIEPVFQLTCRDRNRIGLQSELLNAFCLGIRNVLCLTGDHVALGDHPDAKQVFDLDSVSLLWAVQKLNEGFDMRGNRLKGQTALCAGAVVNPCASPVEPQLLKMKRKIQAGACFFQTQGLFEVSALEPFANLARDMEIPLLMGVLFLKTAKEARFFNDRVSGLRVPEKVITQLERSRDPIKTGIDIAAKIISEAKGLCEGVHIMNVGEAGLIQEILHNAGIRQSD